MARAGVPRRRLGCLGVLAGALLVVLAWIALGGLIGAISGRPAPRGQLLDIGGRSLRLVCEGPRGSGPTVLMQSGAFGFAADWASVQARLAAEGVHSCAYDRAGLGYSDPSLQVEDGEAASRDLERLLAAAHEPGPYILAGHSMAGLYVRIFAGRNPHAVKGVVLVDAAVPVAPFQGPMRSFVGVFAAISRLAGWTASAGLSKPLAFAGDWIGLKDGAAAEKRWAFADGPHNRAGAAEVEDWPETSVEAARYGPFDPALPVAVVTAGESPRGWKGGQVGPARRARHGYYRNVAGASHASLLGERYADQVVKAIDFVRGAVAAKGEAG